MTSSNESIDGTDRRIVDVLRRHGRATLAEIGQEVWLSAPAVKRRIDRLERLGVIQGYTAVIDDSRLGFGLEAFAELQFVGTAPVGSIESMVEEVPEIHALFTIAGDPDALAWIKARDVPDLTRVIDHIRRTGMVTGTKTLIVLGSRIRSSPVPHDSTLPP
jgi:Lrp/AsnC family leucine-responsive transcriptional regulator